MLRLCKLCHAIYQIRINNQAVPINYSYQPYQDQYANIYHTFHQLRGFRPHKYRFLHSTCMFYFRFHELPVKNLPETTIQVCCKLL